MKLKTTFLKTETVSKPEWSNYFKHANQMDKASYFLAEFVYKNKDVLMTKLPEVIYLSSPGASFYSDKSFVNSASLRSPSKFIYTLPSVKVNVLCAILKWEGPVYNFMGESLNQEISQLSQVNSWQINFYETEDNIEIELVCSEEN